MPLQPTRVLDDMKHFEDEENNAEENGREGFRQGLTLTDNPHMRSSLQWEWWSIGWHRELNKR